MLCRRIDHAVLKAGSRTEDVAAGAELCRRLEVRALIVFPCHVECAANQLSGSGVKLGAVVGFPFGLQTSPTKQFEALECLKMGARELDIVANIGAIRAGETDLVEHELRAIMKRTPECLHKVIIETGLLTAADVKRAVSAVARAKPAFIKTGTGVTSRGVNVADVELIKTLIPRGILIKAAGGIRDAASARTLLAAGASLLGTSSTEAILTGEPPATKEPKGSGP